MQIFIHRDGQQFGPYTIEQARDYMVAGNLHAGDLAWYEGAADWAPLSQVPGVVPNFPPTPAPISQHALVPPRRLDAPASAPSPSITAPVASSSGEPRRSSRRSSSGSSDLQRNQKKMGARNMWIGGLICIVGTVITVGSYAVASSSPGGGSYFVAWGAILFGGIQFFQGLILYSKR